MKICTCCGQTKPRHEFSPERRLKSGLTSACRVCRSRQQKIYAKRNPEKVRAAKTKHYVANKSSYRERMREWEKLPKPTRPCPTACEICGRLPTAAKSLALDHSHSEGYFRGWVCHRCNLALGLFGDTLAGVLAAVDYLLRAAP